MTRRNQKNFYQKNQKNNNEKQLVKMLDIKKVNYFRYDVTEIFNSTDIDTKIWNPILASIVTKASRLSIKEAKDYIHELENEQILDKETAKVLSQLLEKYKSWR